MLNPIELWLYDKITYWEMIEQFQKEEKRREKNMTMYEEWLEECKRNKQEVWVLESGIDSEGRVVKLIKLITVIEPTKVNGWHEYYDTSFILWQGDRFRNTNGYIMGLNSFKVACGNNVERDMAKQKLNNLYGKVAMVEEKEEG